MDMSMFVYFAWKLGREVEVTSWKELGQSQPNLKRCSLANPSSQKLSFNTWIEENCFQTTCVASKHGFSPSLPMILKLKKMSLSFSFDALNSFCWVLQNSKQTWRKFHLVISSMQLTIIIIFKVSNSILLLLLLLWLHTQSKTQPLECGGAQEEIWPFEKDMTGRPATTHATSD